MKYDCDIIQDMLPLYNDNVLSEKSMQIINEHLKECGKCCKIYREIKNNGIPQTKDMVYTDKAIKFSGKIRKFRIAMASLAVAAVLSVVSVPLLCFSANNFNTVNFISSGAGVMQVMCTDTEYVEIQSSPRVILAKPDNTKETFISIIESEGYTLISDESNKNINTDNMEYTIKNTYMGDFKPTDGTFIIEKDGKREYVSWSSNKYYSKFVWQ